MLLIHHHKSIFLTPAVVPVLNSGDRLPGSANLPALIAVLPNEPVRYKLESMHHHQSYGVSNSNCSYHLLYESAAILPQRVELQPEASAPKPIPANSSFSTPIVADTSNLFRMFLYQKDYHLLLVAVSSNQNLH